MMTPLERQEFQRLLDYDGPALSDPLAYQALLLAEDRRLVALIGARDDGTLTEEEYFEEVESLCNSPSAFTH